MVKCSLCSFSSLIKHPSPGARCERSVYSGFAVESVQAVPISRWRRQRPCVSSGFGMESVHEQAVRICGVSMVDTCISIASYRHREVGIFWFP